MLGFVKGLLGMLWFFEGLWSPLKASGVSWGVLERAIWYLSVHVFSKAHEQSKGGRGCGLNIGVESLTKKFTRATN